MHPIVKKTANFVLDHAFETFVVATAVTAVSAMIDASKTPVQTTPELDLSQGEIIALLKVRD